MFKIGLEYDQDTAVYRNDLTSEGTQRFKPFSMVFDFNGALGTVTSIAETIKINSVVISVSCFDAAVDSDVQLEARHATNFGLVNYVIGKINISAAAGTTAANSISIPCDFTTKYGDALGGLCTTAAGTISGSITFFGYYVER